MSDQYIFGLGGEGIFFLTAFRITLKMTNEQPMTESYVYKFRHCFPLSHSSLKL